MRSSAFGAQLREWRRIRGLSQLHLALQTDVSQRHISFLETGRSRPSREMVVHLGRALEIPPREQNVLLVAAGHAPTFTETPLEELEHIAATLEGMLAAHEPHMAVLLDRRWNVVRSNDTAARFAALVLPEPPPWLAPPLNLMRLSLHPDGLRRHMTNWEVAAAALLRRLQRQARSHPHDEQLHELVDEVSRYPGLNALSARPMGAAEQLLIPMAYEIEHREFSLFTTIAAIGDANDLTLAELRLETFWPVDRASAEVWAALVG